MKNNAFQHAKQGKLTNFDKDLATQVHASGFQITQAILRNLKKFPTSAGVILMYLADKYNGFDKNYTFPRMSKISEDTGLSLSAVEKQISFLKSESFLYVRRSKSNLYYFTPKLCDAIGVEYIKYSDRKKNCDETTRKIYGKQPVKYTDSSCIEQTKLKDQQYSIDKINLSKTGGQGLTKEDLEKGSFQTSFLTGIENEENPQKAEERKTPPNAEQKTIKGLKRIPQSDFETKNWDVFSIDKYFNDYKKRSFTAGHQRTSFVEACRQALQQEKRNTFLKEKSKEMLKQSAELKKTASAPPKLSLEFRQRLGAGASGKTLKAHAEQYLNEFKDYKPQYHKP